MNCARFKKLILPGALVFLLFAFVGCSKEDLVAPVLMGDAPTMELKAGSVDRDTVPKPIIDEIRVNPISDDGDDLGDKESSSRPRGH